MHIITIQDWLGTDNEIGIKIWQSKYCFNNETFDHWLNRVANGNDKIRELILKKKFLFGGRILANRGLADVGVKVTYSNCYVDETGDSIEEIFDAAKRIARTYSYGGGCGIDLSSLAPRGAKVNNAAKTTTGAVSFMDLYSLTTGLICQEGRRGALMLSLSSDHPDIAEFIDVKNDLSKINFANISVRMSDNFMIAAAQGKDVTLTFTRKDTGEKLEKVVNAGEILHKIAENNWNTGEPGMLFWDRITSWNLMANHEDFKLAGTNPCGELPLPAGGSCLLGSINLSEYVIDPFTDNCRFDMVSFARDVSTCVEELNRVLDEGQPLHPLKEQRECVKKWRQIGLGMFGFADALIKMGLRYGSSESIDFVDKVGHTMITTAIDTSAELARKFGAFPGMISAEKIVNTPFFAANCDKELAQKVAKYGLRNAQLLTIAPTGSISTMIGASGGVEPIFATHYMRTTKSLENRDITYPVFTKVIQEYMNHKGLSKVEDLPSFAVTSENIPFDERIQVQAAWQNHIDNSISSTVNLPESTTVKDIETLYCHAWKAGLKGITVFRSNCARIAILTAPPKNDDEDKKKEPNEYEVVDSTELKRGEIADVPDGIKYRKYKIQSGCGRLYLFVGVDEETGKIYDVFTNTDGVGGCTVGTQANSRLISACIRSGVSIKYIIEQLEKAGTCPSYQYKRGKGEKLSRGKSCSSAIANVLTSIIAETKDKHAKTDIVEDKPNISLGDVCPECGSVLVREGGCNICKECGWSRCS